MPPREYTEREWRNMKLDLVSTLADKRVYRPESLRTIEQMRSWFAAADTDIVVDLTEEVVFGEEFPVEYVTEARQSVWLTERWTNELFDTQRD